MNARRLENGHRLVPRTAMTEDRNTIGDVWEEIGPEHPEYEMWEADARKAETRKTAKPLGKYA